MSKKLGKQGPVETPAGTAEATPQAPVTQAAGIKRLVCLKSTDALINDIAFATIEIDGAPQHVSSPVTDTQAATLLSIPGCFEIFTGSAGDGGRVDAAIRENRTRRAEAGHVERATPDQERLIRELTNSNHLMEQDLHKERDRVSALTEENTKLRNENLAYKRSGVTPVNQ